ncbi:MAG TPA: hypothetical protein VGC41_20840 [Kofleriaceae bacterium]
MPRFGFAFGVIALSGCGLISSNVTSYDLDLPAKSFSVDTNGWQVSQASADAVLAKSCAMTPTVCSVAVTSACPTNNCTGECDAADHTCNLGLEIAVHQTIDLLSEKPELKSIDGATSLLQVTVTSVTYEVTGNTLDIATPELAVYIAPMAVMDPHDAGAQQIGTIAIVPASTIEPSTEMKWVDGGQDVLSETLASFKNPFNVIVGGTLTLHSGYAVPMGKLDANVHIKATASL